MGKQRIVIRVTMADAAARSKALKIIGGFTGVLSAAVEGDEQDRYVLVGDGLDWFSLINKLKNKMGFAELVKLDDMREESGTSSFDQVRSLANAVYKYWTGGKN